MPGGGATISTNQKKETGAPFSAGAAANGLSVDPISGKIVLGNNDPGTLADLLTNRAIALKTFTIKFGTQLAANNNITLKESALSGAGINVGTDAHFSNDNIVANRQLTVTGTPLVLATATGGRGAAYFDTRYTLDAGVVITNQSPGNENVGLDIINGNITFTDKPANGVNTPIFARVDIGGVRNTGAAAVIAFPTVLGNAATVSKIEYDWEPGGQAGTFTGFVSGMQIGTRVVNPGVSTMTWYADLMLGVDDNGVSAANLTIAQKIGLYILPVKAGTITTTLAYGIFQEGTTDLNFFGGKVLIGSTVDDTRKLQVTGGISFSDATAMLYSKVAMNNGAAAAVATFTNAPVAGNPTKWIPFNDNGTVRFIPSF